jgi:hypothetical protein
MHVKLPIVFGFFLPALAWAESGPLPRPTSAPPATTLGGLTVGAQTQVTLHLLTIDKGDHLWTRFGHSALMVMKRSPGEKSYESTVYNWGDADFEASDFRYQFLRGTARFRLSSTGTLNETVTRYARSNRTIHHQVLSLLPAQVTRAVQLLEENIKEQNRYYVYHHRTNSCGTKVRDLLDDVTGGAIKAQLAGQIDSNTDRYYGRLGFAGDLLAEIFNDLFMGRMHDEPMTKYYALHVPEQMMQHFQTVLVLDPKNPSTKVPLVGKPEVLFQRRGVAATFGQGRTVIHLTYLWLALVLSLGAIAFFGQPSRKTVARDPSARRRPRRAGLWLLLWAFPLGVVSAVMVVGFMASTVNEGRYNELLLIYPVTDLALIGVAVRWIKGRPHAGPLLRGYAWFRLGLVIVSVVGHVTGLLYQEPRILIALAAACALGLVALVSRMERAASSAPARSAAEETLSAGV